MQESGRTMPDKGEILAQARWLNESASDLISDVMAQLTGNAPAGSQRTLMSAAAST